ncbi:MAG: hypothetical protein E7655_07185 [Ruminococcaceae bacterium]|nr:hypothetical protein [Oscillospiraceae bacterium]
MKANKATEASLAAYRRLAPDWMSIGLRYEDKTTAVPSFCTPVGADIFASLGVDGIHFCQIEGFGDMVFTVTPSPSDDNYVIPTARTFSDFLRLVLALHGTNLIDQILIFGEKRGREMLNEQIEQESEEVKHQLKELADTFSLTPPDDPIAYLFSLQNEVDLSALRYSEEYYDTLGLCPPQ